MGVNKGLPGRNQNESKDLDNQSFDSEFGVYVTEALKYSPDGSLKRDVTGQLASLIDDTSTTDVVYICKAKIGASTSDAVWQIQKIDTSTHAVFTWADGDSDFDNICDNRTSLTYS